MRLMNTLTFTYRIHRLKKDLASCEKSQQYYCKGAILGVNVGKEYIRSRFQQNQEQILAKAEVMQGNFRMENKRGASINRIWSDLGAGSNWW